jgi:hypothetical protein
MKNEKITRKTSSPMGKIYPKRIQSILNGETPVISTGYVPVTKIYKKTDEVHKEHGKEYEVWIKDGKRYMKIGLNTYSQITEKLIPDTCPVCSKSLFLQKRLDEKMMKLRGKCFDCVVKEETEMRIKGTWELYENKKIIENKLAYARDIKEQILDYLNNNLKKTHEYFNEDGSSEKWNDDSYEETKSFFENELKELNFVIPKLEDLLAGNITQEQLDNMIDEYYNTKNLENVCEQTTIS